MLDSHILNNTISSSGAEGGGRRAATWLTITGSVISGNSITGSAGRGGGVASDGDLTLVNSTVSGNMPVILAAVF